MRISRYIQIILASLIGLLVLAACSNRRNTATTRNYHAINTKYNIHFNAQLAYDEALDQQERTYTEIFSKRLPVYIDSYDSTKQSLESESDGSFSTSIDKTTKAIKLHSIKARPRRDKLRMKEDPEYAAWVNQKEFNPYLKNTWMLLAKSEFHSGNYLRAISSFMYVSSIYASQKEIVGECRLWIARSYTAMGWLYEAENALRTLEREIGVPERLEDMHATVRANYHVENEDREESIRYLEQVIKQAKGKDKTRLRYLLGQLYIAQGNDGSAYEAFKSVRGLTTPHLYSFNAELQQIALDKISVNNKIKKYNNLAKKHNNKEYLDQVYYEAGNVCLMQKDTLNAIEYYHKAVDNSTRNAYDQALSEIKLGNIYFDKREFINAQPLYKSSLSKISAKDGFYKEVHHRSEVLDDLVIHAKVVNVQDSLQHLASLPETERTKIIEDEIARIKKKEEEQKKKEEQAERQTQAEQTISTGWEALSAQPASVADVLAANRKETETSGKFYFYRPDLVEKGRISFQNKWDRRKLEDDWRRKNKAVSIFGDTASADWASEDKDEEEAGEIGEEKTEDIYSVDYYLQQLPLTEEAKQASDLLIADAYYNMGKIYREMLGDLDLASESLTHLLNRYPNTENKEEVYYQLLLINMQRENTADMELYRNRLIAEYSEGKYARPLRDSNYEQNYRQMGVMQELLYENTLEAYRTVNAQQVRTNYQEILDKYPLGYLSSKFELLNALSYAQSRDIVNLGESLTKLIANHPNTDESSLAQGILEHIKDGHILLADGSLLQSIDWTGAYVVPSNSIDEKTVLFSVNEDVEHMILLSFSTGTIDRNELLYQIANYNFSNYLLDVHDLDFERREGVDLLRIKGFKNFGAVSRYVNDAYEGATGLFNTINPLITVVPISTTNFPSAYDKLGMNMYISFYSQAYYKELPQLIAAWDGRSYEERMGETPIVVRIEEEKKEKDEDFFIPPVEQDKKLMADQSQHLITIDMDSIVAEIEARESEWDDKKDISLEDLLGEDLSSKIDEGLAEGQSIYDNPVEGIKSIIQILKRKNQKLDLSEEEKEHLAELENQDKVLKAKQKAYNDSVQAAVKAVKDSLKQLETERIELEKAKIKTRKDELKAIEQAKTQTTKEREQKRQELTREREERRKEQEREREEQRKQKEQERESLLREREERRKQQVQEREQARKRQEELMKQKRKEMEQE